MKGANRSTDPGDLFTLRNIGNLIPPATVDGHSTGDVSEATAIEYSLLVLKVENIVICGHSECGAMKAVLAGARGTVAPNLDKWLHNTEAAVLRLGKEGALDASVSPHNQLSDKHAFEVIDRELADRMIAHVGGL